MIYEYPEEFIIPVVYSDDLKEEYGYRHEEFEPLGDWKLLILDEELQGDKIFKKNTDIEIANENNDINFLKMEVDLLPKLYKEPIFNDNMIEEDKEDKNIKNILSDIDNEYANSETQCIHSGY